MRLNKQLTPQSGPFAALRHSHVARDTYFSSALTRPEASVRLPIYDDGSTHFGCYNEVFFCSVSTAKVGFFSIGTLLLSTGECINNYPTICKIRLRLDAVGFGTWNRSEYLKGRSWWRCNLGSEDVYDVYFLEQAPDGSPSYLHLDHLHAVQQSRF